MKIVKLGLILAILAAFIVPAIARAQSDQGFDLEQSMDSQALRQPIPSPFRRSCRTIRRVRSSSFRTGLPVSRLWSRSRIAPRATTGWDRGLISISARGATRSPASGARAQPAISNSSDRQWRG